MQTDFVFTSESVSSGHPDKLCDIVSDAIVGHHFRQDPLARVVAECAVSAGILFASVRFRSNASLDIASTARNVIAEVGYEEGRFNARDCTVVTSLLDFPSGVERRDERELGEEELNCMPALDQATVFGFACDHTPELMPVPVVLANRLARRFDLARVSKELSYLTPDGKFQVGVEYRAQRPIRVHSLTLLASQREKGLPTPSKLYDDLRAAVVDPVFAQELVGVDEHTRIAINPEGPIVDSGPYSHAGLTGRKGATDTYGGFARHSSSALSGKDPSRVDRIGAYAARHAAKNIVAAELARKCEVQLSYSVGLAEPASIRVLTFGTGSIKEEELERRLRRNVDFRVSALVRDLGLRDLPERDKDGFYPRLATYGQVGRTDLELPWETTDLTEQLKTS
ncbi:MAG: methionine adenosyltransferase [Proteobacteria bacterium]|nr:methionine adenosyltransferase [Pseudomonadota bacterium]